MQIHIVNMHDLQVAKREYSFMNTHFVVVQDSYTLYIEYWYIGLTSPGLFSARSFVCMLFILLHIHSAEHLQWHIAMVGMNDGIKISNETLTDNTFSDTCHTLSYIISDKKLNTNYTVYICRTLIKSMLDKSILLLFLIMGVERDIWIAQWKLFWVL